MKRGKIVTFVCIVFLLLVCFVWSYFYGHLPELLPHSVSYFKFLRGMSAFLKIFPAVLCTAFLVDFSVFFGRNDENSTQRFSAQMFVHFQNIVVSGVIVDRARQRRFESDLMSTAVNGRQIVCKSYEYLIIGIVVLHCDLRRGISLHTAYIDYLLC